MHEIVYIKFVDHDPDHRKPGCYVVRLQSRDAGGAHWTQRDLLLKTLSYPQEPSLPDGRSDASRPNRGLLAAARDGFIAFCCYADNKFSIVLIAPNNQFRTLPLEEPPGTTLYAMEFAEDARTLVLLYYLRQAPNPTGQAPKPAPERDTTFTARFVRWDTGRFVVDTVPGWFACANGRESYFLDSDYRPFTYDTQARRRIGNGLAEARLLRLWQARNSPPVYTGYRQSGKLLPTNYYARELMYAFSGNLTFMFEIDLEDVSNTETEGVFVHDPDFHNDFVHDEVFTADRGIVWSIFHNGHSPFSGFQFLNDQGDFRFLATGPVRMRRGDGPPRKDVAWAPSIFRGSTSYAAGIFEVELARGRVHYTSLPRAAKGTLAGSAVRGDVLGREMSGDAVILMKRGTAGRR